MSPDRRHGTPQWTENSREAFARAARPTWAFQLAEAEESEHVGASPWAPVTNPQVGHSSMAFHALQWSAKIDTDGGATVPQGHVFSPMGVLSHCDDRTP